jgi:hypothetical protein
MAYRISNKIIPRSAGVTAESETVLRAIEKASGMKTEIDEDSSTPAMIGDRD